MSRLEYEVKDRPALVDFKGRSGQGTLKFASYDTIDKDNDVTRRSFIPHGQISPMLISHQWEQTPVAKGTIRSEVDGAYFDFQMSGGRTAEELREWFLLDAGDTSRSEFSYGFSIRPGGSSRGVFEGKSVRFLHGCEDGSPGCIVHEISYCLRGAGIGTQLVSMKEDQQSHLRRLHLKVNAAIEAEHQRQQAELRQMHQRLLAREQAEREVEQREIRAIFQRCTEKGYFR